MKPADLPPKWREFYEECAARREYDGRFIRSLAETLAMREVLEAMQKEEQTQARETVK